MKRILEYNEFIDSKNLGYQKISHVEADNIVINDIFRKLDDEETYIEIKKLLIDIFGKDSIIEEFLADYFPNSNYTHNEDFIYRIQLPLIRCYLYFAITKDDYYLVNVKYGEDEVYYLCDQIDGLENFLTNFKLYFKTYDLDCKKYTQTSDILDDLFYKIYNSTYTDTEEYRNIQNEISSLDKQRDTMLDKYHKLVYNFF